MDNRSKPTTSVPSGEIDDGNCGFALVVSRSAAPVPSAAWLYRFEHARAIRREDDPPAVGRPDRHAIGAAESKVRRLSVSRSKSQIQMSLLS